MLVYRLENKETGYGPWAEWDQMSKMLKIIPWTFDAPNHDSMWDVPGYEKFCTRVKTAWKRFGATSQRELEHWFGYRPFLEAIYYIADIKIYSVAKQHTVIGARQCCFNSEYATLVRKVNTVSLLETVY